MENFTFNALDVETANSNSASICQIGIVRVRNGEIKEQLSLLVNPEQPFTARNMNIHGINGDMTRNSATIPGLEPELRRLLEGVPLETWPETPILPKRSFSQRRLSPFCWFSETFIICHHAV